VRFETQSLHNNSGVTLHCWKSEKVCFQFQLQSCDPTFDYCCLVVLSQPGDIFVEPEPELGMDSMINLQMRLPVAVVDALGPRFDRAVAPAPVVGEFGGASDELSQPLPLSSSRTASH